MTADFLTTPLAQAIGWALLHLIWQGAIVAGLLAAALALLQKRSANVRYAVSCAALAMLPLLAAATAWSAYDPAPVPTPDTMRVIPADAVPLDLARAAVAHATKSTLSSAVGLAHSALPWIVLAWLGGVTVLSIRLVISWSRVRAITAAASPATPEWESVLRQIGAALRLDFAVRLLQSAAVEVPTVIGWLRPAILLPASTISGLTPEQIEMLLAHEVAHIRRNDFLVNLLQSIVETLMFYHPAAWWISGRIRAEREHCCDDLAVEICGSAVRYARALTRLEELRSPRPGLAVAANGGSLLGRIKRLVGAPPDVSNSPRWLAGLGVLAVVAIFFSVPSFPLFAEHESAAPAPAVKPAVAPRPAPSQTHIDVTPDPDDNSDDADDSSDDSVDAGVRIETPEPPEAPEPPEPPDVDIDLDDEPVTPVVAPVPPLPGVLVTPMVAPLAPVAPAAPVPAVAPRPHVAPTPMVTGVRRPHHQIGSSGKLSVDDLIELRAVGVTPAYVDEMRGASLGSLTLDDVVALRAMGVNSDWLREMRSSGVEIPGARVAIELRAQGVSPHYIAEMRAAGYSGLGTRELVELRAQGVTPPYIAAMRDAGYGKLSTRELVELRSQGVNPEYVAQMREAGYAHLSVRELVELRAMNVSTQFVKSLSEAGYHDLSAHDLVRLAATGVNSEFIHEMAKYKH